MTITKPHLLTKMLIWAPKYSAQYGSYDEPVALLHKNKVDFASPVILIDFKAKHLQGQRYCIRKQEAQRHAVGSNGAAPMYIIPMSHFESWQTAAEVHDIAMAVFDE